MKHVTPLLSLFGLATLLAPAMAESSPEAAYQQLRDALSRELSILSSVKDASTAATAVPQLEAVLHELASMDRSYEAEKALWNYIDNTEGVKLPLLELLQRLTVQFMRMERHKFFDNEQLHALLAPQLRAPNGDDEQGAAAEGLLPEE